ncbi:MAG TPA: ABC transporter ATP-binding protein [Anaerolineae bacterium]|nr:ABC transporter ATP-binding protein [Anaerolineae bacterium]HNU03975.1 ABC transporter ATP-binding protein [Anaerolineae bacterium]
MNQTHDHVIRTDGLSKSFGDVQVLKSVNLAVPAHSIFGFLGPNGAGKTTLMKILLGLVRPTGGSGTIFGRDVVRESVAIRERIGYLPQQPRFVEYMTARENLTFAANFFFSGPQPKIRERCEEMLELVGLRDKADRPIKNFSGGEKQRLGIALAQVNYPDLLILDEPASALDPLGRQEVLEVMERLRKHTTVFYSTHILDDVQRVSDRVAILNRGRLLTSGPIEQILNGRDGVVYTLIVKEAPQGFSERLAGLSWVTHVSAPETAGASVWQIGVSDEAAAETALLRFVLEDQNVTVTEFSRKKYELEEIFMELVKGESDGRQS